MMKLLVAAGFLLAATSASLAQGYGYYGSPYGPGAYGVAPGYGLYDYAPGYGGYGYGPYYNAPDYGLYWDFYRSDFPGRGNSAESQR